jgi:hypothetical protein
LDRTYSTSVKNISNPDIDIRVYCIKLLSAVVMSSSRLSLDHHINTFKEVQFILYNCIDDSNYKVRAQSLSTLYELLLFSSDGSSGNNSSSSSSSSYNIDITFYDKAINCLNDNYETVRIEAIKIVWIMSAIYNNLGGGNTGTNINNNMISSINSHVTSNSIINSKIRITDDSFIKISSTAASDVSVHVRSLVSKLQE